MFSSWKTPTWSQRQQELQWMNIINATHDQFCNCDNPTFHLIYCINKFSSAPKPEKDLANIQCLLTGVPVTTNKDKEEDDQGGFLDGELEDLFKEENGENIATTSDARSKDAFVLKNQKK